MDFHFHFQTCQSSQYPSITISTGSLTEASTLETSLVSHTVVSAHLESKTVNSSPTAHQK